MVQGYGGCDVKKPMMVGLGPVVDKDWNVRNFTFPSAWAYLHRYMPEYLKGHGFVAVVAEFEGYFRGSYAAMPVNVSTGNAR